MKLKPAFDLKDLGLRFCLGGAAVAACYILLQMVPWKSFAGIFAAFPAVMIAAVTITGTREGSRAASDIALGASAGMVGCAFCVFTTAFCIVHLGNLAISLFIGLLAWFLSSIGCIGAVQSLLAKIKR